MPSLGVSSQDLGPFHRKRPFFFPELVQPENCYSAAARQPASPRAVSDRAATTAVRSCASAANRGNFPNVASLM